MVELRESVPFACSEIGRVRFGPGRLLYQLEPPAKNALRADHKDER